MHATLSPSNNRATKLPVIPDAQAFIASRALISGAEFRALTGDSHSGFYKKLRQGRLPPPAVRSGPRYTRWRAIDVAEYLADPQAWLAAHAGVSTLASEVSA